MDYSDSGKGWENATWPERSPPTVLGDPYSRMVARASSAGVCLSDELFSEEKMDVILNQRYKRSFKQTRRSMR